ncbi:recombinase family protein [Mesorhizobium sp. B3-1-3]|uniref:recombinase family protein n=1 Tax=unclassified Mesorhizobium TaxID=325217 RepID=UPI00112E14B6|nr:MULTISPECIES: recombinase family protein [unclassified Mesorhizobium]TPI59866.1 recombinase family protein [Mesorhizobium sp. B3-1-8]TPI68222.1 recombinase family protein [Mesorhizobium sp. B3-1-3]
MQDEKQVRVHLLARTAGVKQGDINTGTADQLRDLRAHAAERGWVVAGETAEIGVSGNSTDRPGLNKILALASSEAPPFDILLVVSADRISRDVGMVSQVQRRLQENRIEIHTLEGAWSSPSFETTLKPPGGGLRRQRPRRIADVVMDHEAQGNEIAGNGRVEALTETRPTGVIRAIVRSLDAIARAPGLSLMDWAITNAGKASVAPEILDFATGGTASCSGGRSCARVYLALQGMAIPMTETTTGMDMTRREWWLRAMAEHMAR